MRVDGWCVVVGSGRGEEEEEGWMADWAGRSKIK